MDNKGEKLDICLHNKFTNIRQHNNYLLDHIGYMFRPVNRSSSGLQQNKSKVLLKNWDPNILYSLNKYIIWYWIKCGTYII